MIIHQGGQVVALFIGWADEIELTFFHIDGTDDVIFGLIGTVAVFGSAYQNAVVTYSFDKFEVIIAVIVLIEVA